MSPSEEMNSEYDMSAPYRRHRARNGGSVMSSIGASQHGKSFEDQVVYADHGKWLFRGFSAPGVQISGQRYIFGGKKRPSGRSLPVDAPDFPFCERSGPPGLVSPAGDYPAVYLGGHGCTGGHRPGLPAWADTAAMARFTAGWFTVRCSAHPGVLCGLLSKETAAEVGFRRPPGQSPPGASS